jgi:hypothetical protein
VDLRLDSETPLASLRAQLRYDSASLELLSADLGELLPSTVPLPTIEQRAARVQLNVDDLGGSTVSGKGGLLRLRFRALSPRPSTMVSVQQFAAGDEEGLAVPVMAPRPFIVVVAP